MLISFVIFGESIYTLYDSVNKNQQKCAEVDIKRAEVDIKRAEVDI